MTRSLEQAMRVLAGLTEGDRLVGIISHVGALKDRIDRQVVVRKARTGELYRRTDRVKHRRPLYKLRLFGALLWAEVIFQ